MPSFPQDIGLILDGVAGSEAIDSSGEILDVKGADISDFVDGKSPINYEHRGDDAVGASALDIVGRVLWAKKIYSADDCDTKRQKMFWEKVNLPFIYFIGLLYDKAGHPGAVAAAASIRADLAMGLKPMVSWSVEGSTLSQENHRLTRTVCRKLALTYKPCNRSVQTGIIADPGAPSGFATEEKLDKPTEDIVAEIANKFVNKTEGDDLMYKRLGSSFEASYDPTDLSSEDLTKALEAGGYNAAPGTLTNGSALQREDISERAKKIHDTTSAAKAALRDWWGGESLKGTSFSKFLKMKLPEASEEFLDKFASAVDDYRLKGVGKGQMLKFEDLEKARKAAVKRKSAPKAKATPRVPKAAKVSDAAEPEGGDISFNPSAMLEPKPKTVPLAPPKKYAEEHAHRPGPMPTPKGRAQAYFDPDQGILHTHLGSYPMQIPRDATYHAILRSPEVQKPHEEAMKNWIQLHKILKAGHLPEEVAMHAALFSGQSPSNPVPMQEIGYSHLQDLMAQGMNPAKPGGVNDRHKRAYMAAVLPETASLPEYMREHWQGPAGETTRYKDAGINPTTGHEHAAGQQRGMLYPAQKWASVAKYHGLHPDLVKLLEEHGVDGATIAHKLISQKLESKKYNNRAKGLEARTQETQPRYQEATGQSAAEGFAPKTLRYMLGMMGAGNLHVPDTHFIRHAFGLPSDHQVRDETEAELGRPLEGNEEAYSPNEHLKSVLWYGTNAHHIGAAMDKFYGQHHPAVQMVREKYGKDIAPDQAIFPGFWAHWLSIAPHEASQAGRRVTHSHNAATNHEVYWNAVRNILKHYGLDKGLAKDELGLADAGDAHPTVKALPLHMKTFLAQKAMEKLMGETPASLFYAQKLLPLLLRKSAGKFHHGSAAIAKAEALAIEMGAITSQLRKAQEGERAGTEQWQGKPVTPGEAQFFDKKFHILGSDKEMLYGHFDGEENKGLTKVNRRTHGLHVVREPQSPNQSYRVEAQHGIPELTRHPEQKALIHGLDVGGNRGRLMGDKRGFHAEMGGSYWLKGPQGQPVLIKQGIDPGSRNEFAPHFGEAHREAAYYNLGKEFFGMGDYLTPTASFTHPVTGQEHIAVEGIPGAEHYEGLPSQYETLKRLHDAGELDKLGMMNKILGNSDRNYQNYMFSKHARGGMKLIDHGYAFGGGLDSDLPSYLDHHINGQDKAGDQAAATAPWHPAAQAWLQGLQPHVLMQHLEANGVPVDMKTQICDRLTDMKAVSRLRPDMPRQHHLAVAGSMRARHNLMDRGLTPPARNLDWRARPQPAGFLAGDTDHAAHALPTQDDQHQTAPDPQAKTAAPAPHQGAGSGHRVR